MPITENFRLGEMLVTEGLISQDQLKEALDTQKRSGKRLGDTLVNMGFISEEAMASALSKQLGIPYITLYNYEIDPEIIKNIPEEIVRKYRIIPVDKTGNTLTVALSDPANIFILDELKILTKCEIIPLISYESDISRAIEQYYPRNDQMEQVLKDMQDADLEITKEDNAELNIAEMKDLAEDAPVIKLVNVLLLQAITDRASDIHIECYEDSIRIRYRVDGSLIEIPPPPKKLFPAIVSRIKILSELDIAERRLPQDGRFKVKLEDKAVDLRVSIIPTVYGEKVVMRILDRANLVLDLTKLGMESEALTTFLEIIQKPYGMILVSGPTGSGKTTTLYSALSTLNKSDINIMTIEDPVEYQLRGVNQVQARSDIGLTFAAGLRSFLRQDPDVILVGEIRDLETAEIGVKAAMTGHLVFSTIHTNDAPSTITRLTDMGVEPFLVTASLIMVCAQRLVRRICPKCKVSYTPSREVLQSLGISPDAAVAQNIVFSRGTGCDYCKRTGFRGRLSIYELLVMNDALREALINGESLVTIKRLARLNGMKTLRESGIIKVLEGITTVEEILGATIADES
jgi:type IV pilus assembly protein PilB